MQLCHLPAILAVLALAPIADAVGFMAPHKTSLVSQSIAQENKDMPVTQHSKKAGDDYKKGSPLFEKQEKLKKEGNDKKPAKLESNDAAVTLTVPPADKATDPGHWWSMGRAYPKQKDFVKNGITYFFSYFILVMLVALIWIKCSYPPRSEVSYSERQNNQTGFAYSIFSREHCLGHHGSVCFCAWCCAPLRLADTYSKKPSPIVKSFWAALVLIAVLGGLQQLTMGFTGLIMLCMVVFCRQQIRRKYGIERGGTTWCTDFISWIFCPCCTMAQEARQVDFVQPVGSDEK